MITPYDWQEGIGNRAQYIEAKLRRGIPILAASTAEGVLVYSLKRQGQKTYEVYDRLAISMIGQIADIEAMRVASVEFSHREGYNRSEEDVTIARLVTGMSPSVKKAFSDFNGAPFVLRALYSEVNETPEEDQFYVLDFDGDYIRTTKWAIVAGSQESYLKAKENLTQVDPTIPAKEQFAILAAAFEAAMSVDHENLDRTDYVVEAVLIARSDARENRFTFDYLP